MGELAGECLVVAAFALVVVAGTLGLYRLVTLLAGLRRKGCWYPTSFAQATSRIDRLTSSPEAPPTVRLLTTEDVDRMISTRLDKGGRP